MFIIVCLALCDRIKMRTTIYLRFVSFLHFKSLCARRWQLNRICCSLNLAGAQFMFFHSAICSRSLCSAICCTQKLHATHIRTKSAGCFEITVGDRPHLLVHLFSGVSLRVRFNCTDVLAGLEPDPQLSPIAVKHAPRPHTRTYGYPCTAVSNRL